MFPLFLIPIYVVGSFAKTVVSVVIISLIHGLFILPVILSLSLLNCSKDVSQHESKRKEENKKLVLKLNLMLTFKNNKNENNI